MVGTKLTKSESISKENRESEQETKRFRKKNDIILWNILNIGKIKRKPKQLQIPINTGGEKVAKNEITKSLNKSLVSSFPSDKTINQEPKLSSNKHPEKSVDENEMVIKVSENKCQQLSKKVKTVSVGDNHTESNLNQEVFDNMIQDQFDILSLAVENLLSISSVTSESVSYRRSNSENTLSPLVEDIDFQDVLNMFSKESVSMRQQKLSEKCDQVNSFPTVHEGRNFHCLFISILNVGL